MSECLKGQDGNWSMSGAQVCYENVEVREWMFCVPLTSLTFSVGCVNSVRTAVPALAPCRAGGLAGCEIPLVPVNPTAGSFLSSVWMWPWPVLRQGLAPVTAGPLAALSGSGQAQKAAGPGGVWELVMYQFLSALLCLQVTSCLHGTESLDRLLGFHCFCNK